MRKRIYKYISPLFLGFLLSAWIISLIGVVLSLISLPEEASVFFALEFIGITYLTFFEPLRTGLFKSIFITAQGIEFQDKKLVWDEVRLTAYRGSGQEFSYYILIGKEYCNDINEIKRKVRVGPCIYINNIKKLNLILENYKAKILILDAEANEMAAPTAERKATNKINEILIRHNRTYTT